MATAPSIGHLFWHTDNIEDMNFNASWRDDVKALIAMHLPKGGYFVPHYFMPGWDY